MELKIQTEIGEMTGVFESTAINCYQEVWTAWFKEKESVVVQANSVNEAIDELHRSLEVLLEFEREEKNK